MPNIWNATTGAPVTLAAVPRVGEKVLANNGSGTVQVLMVSHVWHIAPGATGWTINGVQMDAVVQVAVLPDSPPPPPPA